MEESPKTEQIMDIQPPKQSGATPAPVVSEPTLVREENQTQTEQSENIQADDMPNDVQEAPAEDQPTDETVSPATPDNDAEAEETLPLLAATTSDSHKSRTPVLAVFCALVISVVFGALAVYAFTADKQADDKPIAATESVDQTPKTPAATAVDVDAANASVDESLNALDEAADYSDSAVNDAALGL